MKNHFPYLQSLHVLKAVADSPFMSMSPMMLLFRPSRSKLAFFESLVD